MSYNLGTAQGQIVVDGSGASKGFETAGAAANVFFQAVKAQMGVFDQLANRLIKIGLTGTAGLTGATTAAAKFEQALSAVQAVSGATEAEMKSISAAALRIGADTSFTATEAASAMEELVKAGVSVKDTLNGAADAAVALAAAGGISLPQAAEIAANAMNNFKLTGENMPYVADLIAGAANASAISVGEFGSSLSQAGAVAAISGLRLDDLAVAIAQMGNAGIKGSDAGTSLKTMLMNLQPTTDKQKEKFEQLGLTVDGASNAFFDAQGNIKSMVEIQGILAEATSGMTRQQKLASLEIMFGSDAIRAAAILADQGAAGYNEMAASMKKVGAADVAATRLDNLAGSIEAMKGSFESAAIAIGTPFLGVIRAVVDAITFAVNIFNRLPAPIKDVIAVTFAFATSMSLLTGILIKVGPALAFMIGKFYMLRTMKQIFSIFQAGWVAMRAGQGVMAGLSIGMNTLSASGTLLGNKVNFLRKMFIAFRTATLGLRASMALAGAAVAIAAGAYIAFAQAQADAEARVQDLTSAIELDTGAIAGNTRATVYNTLVKEGAIDAAKRLGVSSGDVLAAALGEEAAQKRVAAITDQTTDKINALTVGLDATSAAMVLQGNDAMNLVNDTNLLNGIIGRTNGEVQASVAAFKEREAALGNNADVTSQLGDASEDAADKVDKLTAAMFRNADAAIRLSDTKIRAEAAIDDFAAAIKRSNGSVNENTEKGRAARSAANELSGALKLQVAELLKTDSSGVKAAAAMKRARDSFIASATAAGMSAPKAKALARELGLIPGKISTQFKAPGAAVTKGQAADIKAAVKAIPGLKNVRILAQGARKSKQEVDDFMNSFEGIPPEKVAAIRTAYEMGGVEAAKIALESMKDKGVTITVGSKTQGARDAKKAIDSVNSKTVTITVKTASIGSSGMRPMKRAKGGPVKKKNPYWVGERGPELMFPEDDGTILNSRSSMAMVAGMNRIGTNIAEMSPMMIRAMESANTTMNTLLAGAKTSIPSAHTSQPVMPGNRSVEITQHIYNPVAETSSETAVQKSTRLSALGVFG